MTVNPYYVKYPVLQVRPYGILVYERIEWLLSRRKESKPLVTSINRSKQNNEDGTVKGYTGILSPYAKKRLKKAIQLLVASALWKEAPNFKTGGVFKFKVNFITLTLPCPQGDTTDKEIKTQCLDPFIKRMKRKFKLNNYVWRAERQGNGNLHFHLITDCYIHYSKIRNDWNDCINKFGYIDQFESKHKHRNPNSTDVHSVTKIKNLSQYFAKYMAKDEITQEKAKHIPFKSHSYRLPVNSKKKTYWKPCKTIDECRILGKVWDCSANLKRKDSCEMLLESEAYELYKRVTEDPEVKTKYDPLYSLAFLTDDQFKYYLKGSIRADYESYLSRVRGDALAS